MRTFSRESAFPMSEDSHSASQSSPMEQRTPPHRPSTVRAPLLAVFFCLLCASPVHAERVSVAVEGVEGDVLESVRASIELHQYEDRDVSAVEVRRLFERAAEQIR